MSSPFAPRLSRLVQKLYDSPDGLEGVGGLVQPVMQLYPTPDDLALLSQERLFSSGGAVAAGGGALQSWIELTNNGAATVGAVQPLLILERVAMRIATAGPVLCGFQLLGVGSGGAFSRDGRNQTTGAGRVRSGTTAGAAPAGPTYLWHEYVGTGIMQTLAIPPIMIGPGQTITFVVEQVNLAITSFSMAWRERLMEPSETAQL